MVSRTFCSSCGTECPALFKYCPACGMTAEQEAVCSFVYAHKDHCTGCGAKNGLSDTYCSVCGIECNAYTAVKGASVRIKSALGDIKLSDGFSGIAGKAADAIKLSPTLDQVKERSVFVPAIVFALVAISVGLILSLIIDLIVANAVSEWVENEFYGMLGNVDVRLGTVTIWLLTCLGGLRGTLRVEAGFGDWSENINANATLSVGVVLLVLIPVIALTVARQVRKAFISSKHSGKELRVLDGVLGAGMFTIVNLILMLFPSPLAQAATRVAEYELYDFASLRVSIGPQFWNVLLFSFLIGFIFAMPGLGSVMETLKSRTKFAAAPLVVAARYIRLTLLAALVAAVTLLIYTAIYIAANEGGYIIGEGIGYALMGLPNLTVWLMPFFTGGRLELSVTDPSGMIDFGGSATAHAHAFGAEAGVERYTQEVSWFGLFIIIAGLLIAVAAMHKILRSSENFTLNGLISVVVSSVALWLLSLCTNIGLSVNASMGRESMSGSAMLTSATFVNFLLCAVFMAAAFCIVYAARRVPTFDKVVEKLSSPLVICALAAVGTIIACLTVDIKMDNMGYLPFYW